ncbi:D-isomer specific 2-hydroxyacid dehydrogenase family protein [Sphaerisporangium corydalis]|uniref:D-isomer specific 2-hydroxyacid dehydrogenase family protein n=1 Tax=Sphaerisporangium corydalis TaxID=1441875 RepID=A0ABV9EA18_9ACTN|nr:D-isomer specific 2-hydroxyacid dehydrogenase family protein [Sphaerisporangium corydalis]
MEALIAIAPYPEEADPRAAALETAVSRGGGTVVPVADANGLVWLDGGRPGDLGKLLDGHPGIGWVQFPWAGVERFAATGVFQHPATFTCAKGSFAGQVSEHALMLVLACLRNIPHQARTPRWSRVAPRSLHGLSVTILGGGGIAEELVRLLGPFGCRVRVLRRRPDALAGADETLPPSALSDVLPGTDVLVLALALTAETRHVIGGPELALLPAHAVIVNVARGAHIDTGALVEALAAGRISGAGLDVTDPEPLPEGHPLWSDPRVLITSHCADSPEYVLRMLCERIEHNVRHLRAGTPLDGTIDPTTGY